VNPLISSLYFVKAFSGWKIFVTDCGAVAFDLIIAEAFTGLGNSGLLAAPFASQQHGFLRSASYQNYQLRFFPFFLLFY
jgi:hypothetical protein